MRSPKESIPKKANHILNILLTVLALITLRVWHLAVVQHDARVEQARRPRERTVIQPAERATIRDRFGIPLAINKVGYQAAVVYSQLRDIPSVRWERTADGKRVRRFCRREHIESLSHVLANELALDQERVEDLIHSKAALYYSRPFVIAENITEQQYHRLRILQREWPGLHVSRVPIRHYPKGKVASHLLGYMGAINREEYEAIVGEIRQLQRYLQDWESGMDPLLPEGLTSSRQVRIRLKELKERAYTITDTVGKSGIEARFEEQLRGFHGRRHYYSDARGNYLRELPGMQSPLPGQQLVLSISSELQEYAEELLIQNEHVRDGRSAKRNRQTGGRSPLRQPFVKGGAIVALDPNTGEVLTLASYPRYDPNDFVMDGDEEVNRGKTNRILRWFESDVHLGQVWDGKCPLERERPNKDRLVGGTLDEPRWMDWDGFLSVVLPDTHSVKKALRTHGSIQDAVQVHDTLEAAMVQLGTDAQFFCTYDVLNVLYSGDAHTMHRQREPHGELEEFRMRLEAGDEELTSLTNELKPYFSDVSHNYDKVLLADLYRLAVDAERFSPELLEAVGGIALSEYRHVTWAFLAVDKVVKGMVKELFHELDWRTWREEEGKAWLKEQREEEERQGRYARPYLDLYDRKERALFEAFWEQHRWQLLSAFVMGIDHSDDSAVAPYFRHCATWYSELAIGAHSALEWNANYHLLREALEKYDAATAIAYLQTMRSYNELDRPLLGRYRALRRENGQWLEKHLAAGFYPVYGYGYVRSHAYRQATVQGSLFKLVVAYEALRQRYHRLQDEGVFSYEDLNPMVMIDEVYKGPGGWNVGRWMDGEPVPRMYRGGRMPRSYRTFGEVDLPRAIEMSVNPYFALLAGDHIEDPDDLLAAARSFSYGARTGIDLPGEISGGLPEDLHENRTGLYSLSMGQHSLVNTPLQSAIMLATLANGGQVLRPNILKMTVAADPCWEGRELLRRERFPFSDALQAAGIGFPLLTAAVDRNSVRSVSMVDPEVVRWVDLPDEVRRMLFQGMRQSVSHCRENRGGSLSWVYRDYRKTLQSFLKLEGDFIGKSSTSEILETVDLDIEQGTNIYNHIWFGGVSFDDTGDGRPETYVVKDDQGRPELVVVVYLRYGGYGKEGSPVAGDIVAKWREIRARHAEDSL